MSTWKTNTLKVLSYWMFTNYISKLHLSIINSIYCIVINELQKQQKKNPFFFFSQKKGEISMCVYVLLKQICGSGKSITITIKMGTQFSTSNEGQ